MEHISTIIDTMFNSCPHCGAKPFQPCTTAGYTHTERNR